jgi:hypothetical protein
MLGTVVIPLRDSIRGYRRFHSLAWFLHPIISFRVALIYTINVLKNKKSVSKIK